MNYEGNPTTAGKNAAQTKGTVDTSKMSAAQAQQATTARANEKKRLDDAKKS